MDSKSRSNKKQALDSQSQKDKHYPKVTVISIALDVNDFSILTEKLRCQTYQDYEFIGEVGGTIPEAWNRAVARAQGKILVFTETDARPLTDTWLEELVNSVPDSKTIVKGLEITGLPWDMSNLAGYKDVFSAQPFDPAFQWAEDTELLSRLKAKGIKLIQVQTAPVVHLQKLASKHHVRRAFRYGLYWSRLRHRYADPVELANITLAGKMLVAALLNLIGLAIGYILFWPERRNRKQA